MQCTLTAENKNTAIKFMLFTVTNTQNNIQAAGTNTGRKNKFSPSAMQKYNVSC
jgi:hypothetical protein